MLIESLFWGTIFATLVVVLVARFRGIPTKWAPIIGWNRGPNLNDPTEFKNHFYYVYNKLCACYDAGYVDLSEWDYAYQNLKTASYKFKVRDLGIAIIHLRRAEVAVNTFENRELVEPPRNLPTNTSRQLPQLGE